MRVSGSDSREAVAEVAAGAGGAQFDEGGAWGEARDIFAKDCKLSKGELEFDVAPPGPYSGICNEIEVGRFEGICEKVAEVGENAAAAERFAPDRGMGDDGASGVAGCP